MGKVKIHYPQSDSGIPAGSVVIWSGAATDIPSGWALCDGTNGTPDLRDRFVVGAGRTYQVGAVGGEASHALATAEMPVHRHGVLVSSGAGSGGDMVSTIYTSSSKPAFNKAYGESIGQSKPHNNLPPYYALCYIVKL